MPQVLRAGAEAPFILTLDIGTSSVRALLFDRRARSVEGVEGRVATTLRTTPDGGAEMDADALLAQVGTALDQALQGAGDLARKLAGVGVCTFWHSLVGLSTEGEALTPLYTWGDTRGVEEAEELKRRLGEGAVHRRTGCVLHPGYLPAKILWLSRSEVGRRVARWMSFGEYLTLRLFGSTAASVSMASGGGLFDRLTGAWDGEILKAISVRPDQLSPLTDVTSPFRGLLDPHAARWPVLRDLPWIPPVGDGACNNLGSGCVKPERLAVMIGTSAAIRVLHDAEDLVIPWGVFAYHVDRRRMVVGGALSDGGNLVEWIRKTFRIDSEDEIARMDPGAHGLTFLPFLGGERSPGWVAGARGWIGGLRFSTRPPEILRAGMEAVACRLAVIHDLLNEVSPQKHDVVASGGALVHSPAWMQIVADALGCPVTASAEPEASSRGAALLALEALGITGKLQDFPVSFGVTFQPAEHRHEAYREAIARQRRAYDLLIALHPAEPGPSP